MKLFLLLSALIVAVMCRSEKTSHHRHHRHRHGELDGDRFCPEGYDAISQNLDGTGKEWSEPHPLANRTIDECAATCKARSGCTGFEYAVGDTEHGACGTYTGGDANIKDDEQRLEANSNWRSCMQKPSGSFTVDVGSGSSASGAGSAKGLIMAGGGIYNPPSPTIYQTSVEMYFPETNTSCDLPPLPTGRAGLTLDVVQDVVVACGGDPTLQSCMMLVDGEWIEFYTTKEIRRGFTSWVTPRGLRLLGSFIAPPSNFSETTELVPVSPWDEGGYSWNLAHPSARFCSIAVGEELIMTGGVDHYNHVTKYSMEGETAAMPDMIHGRMGHACSWYSTGDQQMLIVAGGSDSSHQLISSTEVMALGGSGWKEVGDLMRPMGGLKNAKIGNNVYLSGGWSGDSYHDEIVMFNQDTEEWEEVGKMGESRINHGMTAASSTFCNV